MATEQLLDLKGIDAVLARFKARRAAQSEIAQKASSLETDRPNLISAEASRTMQLRFRMIADRLTSEMTQNLRANVTFSLESLEIVRFKMLIDAMPSRTTIFMVDVPELPIPGFLRADAETVTSMIDRMLGGRGISSELERDLTAIEQRVVRDSVQMILSQHQNALSQMKPLTMRWTRTIGSPDELRPLPQAEAYVAATYKAMVDATTQWTLVFALPIGPLVNAIESVSALPIKQQESREDRRARVQRALNGVTVDVSVKLGDAELTLEDVMHLEVGDVVMLDRRKQDHFDLSVEGIPKYRGRLGRNNSLLSFKVVEAIAAPEQRPMRPKA